MKKQIFTLILSIMAFGLVNAQTVIFDPATYGGELPSGMEVVEMDGSSYLQVVVDGWNSALRIPEVKDILGTQFTANVKFSQGSSTIADGLTLGDISSVVQLMDTVNQVPPSWDPEGLVPANTQLAQNPTLEGWNFRKADITTEQKFVHQIQFFGQETVTWGPTVGDTAWIGTIRSVDASVLFDPAALDAATLPEGMEVVEEGGEKYLKATVDAWNTNITIAPFETGKNNKMKFKVKYDAGDSGQDAATAQTFVKISDAAGTNELGMGLGNPAPTDFMEIESDIKSESTAELIQIAVQETEGWTAVSGAVVYLGKITVSYAEAVLVDPPATSDITFSTTAPEIDGLYDDAYDVSPVNIVDRVALNETDGDIAPESSYGEWMCVADLDYFYFYIEINDDDMFELGESTSPWMNDGIEIFMDIQNRRYSGGEAIAGEQHQMRVNLGTETPLTGDVDGASSLGMPGFFGDNDTTNIEYAIVQGSLGYSIEAKMPWATWFRTSSNTNADAVALAKEGLKEGMKVAFEVSIIDADAVDGRKSILNWANNTGEDKAYQTNEYYGELTLKGGFPVGIIDNDEVEVLNLYPNPASDVINVVVEDMAAYEIYNMMGAKVMSSVSVEETTINVSTLNNGVYVIRTVDVSGNVAIAKFNKQ